MYTAHPGPAWIDSGELATVSHTLGIPHPTGSPLYVLLSRVLVALTTGGFTVLTTLSGVSVAVAVTFIILLASRSAKAHHGLVAAAVGLMMAVAPSVWRQANSNEIYGLQLALFAVFLWFWLTSRHPNRGAMTGLLAGLAFANHQSAVFLAPVLLAEVWPHRRRAAMWAQVVGFGLVGSTLYAYLPIRSSQSPLLNWGGTHGWDAFWRHVTGWQYSNWVGANSWAEFQQSAEHLGGLLWSNAPWVGLPLAAVGWWWLWQRRRSAAVATLAAGLLCATFGLNFPNPDVEAFYLLLFVLVLVWAGFGLSWLMKQNRWLGWSAAAIMLLSASYTSYASFDELNARTFNVPEHWVLDALETVEPGSVILTSEWDHYSPWLYLRFVKGIRPDVLWLDTELLRRSWYPDFIRQADLKRYEAARPALLQLAPQIELFESGQPYDPAQIESAYAEAIFALSLGQPGPVYVDGVAANASEWGVERVYVRRAREVPWGLLTRVFRPGETIGPLPPWPRFRNASVRPGIDPRARFNLSLYGTMRRARQAFTPLPLNH